MTNEPENQERITHEDMQAVARAAQAAAAEQGGRVIIGRAMSGAEFAVLLRRMAAAEEAGEDPKAVFAREATPPSDN